MKPLVSIITVCKNAASTIERTMRSVAGQSYDAIEYIIVDAVSTDGTVAVVKSLRPLFRDRLTVISEPDRGIYDAMNKGIGHARGEIIGIINSDDWYEPDAVALMVELYTKAPGGVYYGLLRCFSGNDEVMIKSVTAKFLHTDHVGHPAYFVSRSVYEQHGTFLMRYTFASDYELMLRFIHNGVPFHQCDRVIANYRFGGVSSRGEKITYEEYFHIRYTYGYLSRSGLLLRILRNRLYFFFRNILGFLR
ncbi:MAG: glycosyltransferase [Bacteroidetes bacterium]|nr:glycosyltransferase [Bacteroidota bacterium]